MASAVGIASIFCISILLKFRNIQRIEVVPVSAFSGVVDKAGLHKLEVVEKFVTLWRRDVRSLHDLGALSSNRSTGPVA